MSKHGAVAIDMGASSARFAAGYVEKGKIKLRTIEQVPHEPSNGKWQTPLLKDLCERAVNYARENFTSATVGIDTWGVDHGFLNTTGELIQNPVAYRDESHTKVYEEMFRDRRRLFELTGIQHQPFNTLYQLVARKNEHPEWPHVTGWQLLPDLFGYFLTGEKNYESTQCSTTQLVGTDGLWCEEAFNLTGWTSPMQQPQQPGRIIGQISDGVALASVASHDTASAICGLGTLNDKDIFLNIGTWSLFGTLLDCPLTSPTAESGGWTNERAHNGQIRFLKNIPGFYIINRIHEELKIVDSVADWLESADQSYTRHFDYFNKSLYNPMSMIKSVQSLMDESLQSTSTWAALAQNSLVECMITQPTELGEIVNRQFERIRVSGGGSHSKKICQGLANATGLKVVSGPSEATLMGNIAMQLVAANEVPLDQIASLIDASIETKTYQPVESL